MVTIDTLKELPQLKNSGFGRPSPRHGLTLLYWFVNDCVHFNANGLMVLQDHPRSKKFGFHRFHNIQVRGDYPLPNENLPYYEVGNLNAPGADELPTYVRKNFTRNQDGNNKDRIIVQMKGDFLDKVYITEHINRSDFGQTHEISKDLITTIKNMTIEDFLLVMGTFERNNHSQTVPLPKRSSCCTIL